MITLPKANPRMPPGVSAAVISSSHTMAVTVPAHISESSKVTPMLKGYERPKENY